MWSVDFFISTIIIVFISMMFILLWNGLAIRWNVEHEYTQMYTDAIFAADALLTTPGYPESWENLENTSTANAFGLVNSRNEINNMKLEKLNETEYDTVRKKIGLARYDFEMMITDLSGEETYYSFGMPSGQNNSVVLERMALLNNTPVIVNIEVWK